MCKNVKPSENRDHSLGFQKVYARLRRWWAQDCLWQRELPEAWPQGEVQGVHGPCHGLPRQKILQRGVPPQRLGQEQVRVQDDAKEGSWGGLGVLQYCGISNRSEICPESGFTVYTIINTQDFHLFFCCSYMCTFPAIFPIFSLIQ